MDLPDGLVSQNELPVERDAVQCRDGRWFMVQLRLAPVKIVAEAATKKEIMAVAETTAELPLWEEHYVHMILVKCVPPKGVFRHPQTSFLVTDGSPRPAKTVPNPDSHVRLKVIPEAAPETPRSAGWREERPSDWKIIVKKLIQKL